MENNPSPSPYSKYFSTSSLRETDLRRLPLTARRTFEVQEMWDTHHEITRMLLIGGKNVDIAAKLGVSEAMVSYTKNSKVVKDKLSIMRGARDADTMDLSKRILRFGPKCLNILEDIIEGKGVAKDVKISLRAKYADRHLERMGHGPVKKVFTASTHLSTDDIEDIKTRARSSGVLVDVTPEPSTV